MLSDLFISELSIVIRAQFHILQGIDPSIADLKNSLRTSELKLINQNDLTSQLNELESLMAELEADQDLIEIDDFGDFEPEKIKSLYTFRQQSVWKELRKIGFKNWQDFVINSQKLILLEGESSLIAYESLLAKADLDILQKSNQVKDYQWDKWDYIFVGASGVLASLTDYLLVGIPHTLTNGEYAGQLGSPITAWLKNYNTNTADDWFAKWARELSQSCKVPYDATSYIHNESIKSVAGMTPSSHRLQSLGHDPVLGFVFGILDILRGTITGFSYDKLSGNHSLFNGVVWANREPIGLIEAILLQLGHLISDVGTPMGLPAPFMTLIQAINVGNIGEKGSTVGEVARWMYLNGYDFRHFLVSGLTPAVIEIILRAYLMLRHYSEHGNIPLNLASHPKYRTMLMFSHGVATLGNAGKITLLQGNPLAVNYAQWLTFIRYLVPSLKYWLFDQHKFTLRQLRETNEKEWNTLLQNSDQIFKIISPHNFSEITLNK